MILVNTKKMRLNLSNDNEKVTARDYIVYEYIASKDYSYEEMLKLMQILITHEFKNHIIRITTANLNDLAHMKDQTKALKSVGYDLSKCLPFFRTDKYNTICLNGITSQNDIGDDTEMEMTLVANTDLAVIACPEKELLKYIGEAKTDNYEVVHFFDEYMDQLEDLVLS